MKVTIAGTGYVGLGSAAVLAHIGHTVTCVDVDAEKIESLKAGECPIFEKGLPELLAEGKPRMTFTPDYAPAYRGADVIIVAVGTPEKTDGSANLNYVFTVARQIAQSVNSPCVIAMKSTVPIGTNDKIEEYVKKHLVNDVPVAVVSNPEFLSQGTAVHDMLHANRIVVGTNDPHARERMAELYRPLNQPIVFTDRRSAEMIKYASNDFLALKISYINEIANLCERLGADVKDVAYGMGLDPRIGPKFLQAGIGYGGSCFPKDTQALHWLSSYYDYELKTVKAAIEVNENQKLRLIKKTRRYFPRVEGLTVAVLGLTFKPGTDDLREAPSLDNVPILLDDGASVRAWDPCGVERFKHRVSGDITYCASPKEALKGADLCMIFTEWPQVKALAPEDFITAMKTPIILDGRNCFDPGAMAAHPLVYDSIGRRTINNLKRIVE